MGADEITIRAPTTPSRYTTSMAGVASHVSVAINATLERPRAIVAADVMRKPSRLQIPSHVLATTSRQAYTLNQRACEDSPVLLQEFGMVDTSGTGMTREPSVSIALVALCSRLCST